MIPWTKLATAKAPDGTELSLWQRGEELVVRADGADLMSNRLHASEELLAELGCEGLGEGARVLIGGLGLGYTLRVALERLPRKAEIVVAELVPEIVDWVRGPAGAGALLDDPRVVVEIGDVGQILRAGRERFDAILLDVDNGPRAVTQAANRGLYSHRGLIAAARALRPGGRLGIWSAGPEPSFERQLAAVGLAPSTVHTRARGRAGGARHVIFLGARALR